MAEALAQQQGLNECENTSGSRSFKRQEDTSRKWQQQQQDKSSFRSSSFQHHMTGDVQVHTRPQSAALPSNRLLSSSISSNCRPKTAALLSASLQQPDFEPKLLRATAAASSSNGPLSKEEWSTLLDALMQREDVLQRLYESCFPTSTGATESSREASALHGMEGHGSHYDGSEPSSSRRAEIMSIEEGVDAEDEDLMMAGSTSPTEAGTPHAPAEANNEGTSGRGQGTSEACLQGSIRQKSGDHSREERQQQQLQQRQGRASEEVGWCSVQASSQQQSTCEKLEKLSARSRMGSTLHMGQAHLQFPLDNKPKNGDLAERPHSMNGALLLKKGSTKSYHGSIREYQQSTGRTSAGMGREGVPTLELRNGANYLMSPINDQMKDFLSSR
jgi:hypothetical protein